jgi:hypothetical protein
VTFGFSEGFPGPRESTAVRLSMPDDVSGQLNVQGWPHMSTAVVSNALACLIVPKPSPDERARTYLIDDARVKRHAREHALPGRLPTGADTPGIAPAAPEWPQTPATRRPTPEG